ncbi:DUF3883 domain-containing protein [Dietzia maris]
MEILDRVRDELLSEAAASPAMLTDIAGLERYVSESYANRTFIELLQNADDAGAHDVVFIQGPDWVLAANSGKVFSELDFRSICRSASSKKSRGESIGYRGIGFKSVVGLATRVHLISGELSATFDRKLTRATLGLPDLPVPLVRIPHPMSLNDADLNQTIHTLKEHGHRTFFILSGIDKVQVENEFEKFDSDHLLFLRNVEKVRTSFSREELFSCRRETRADGSVELETTSPTTRETWRILSGDGVSVAVATESGRAVPLKRSESLVHAFLPTQEDTGIPARINGDFSTDPSRTRVVLDKDTDVQLDRVAKLVSTIISKAASSNSEADHTLVQCLTPYVDDVTLQFERSSFRVALATKIRSQLTPLRDRLALGPAWLNETDSKALGGPVGKSIIFRDANNPSPLANLATFCGIETVGTDAVFRAARDDSISPRGFAQLVGHVAGSVIPTSVSFNELGALPQWPTSVGLAHLRSVAENSLILDESFFEWIMEAGLEPSAVRHHLLNFDTRLDKALPITFTTVQSANKAGGIAKTTTTDTPRFADPFAPAGATRTEIPKSQNAHLKWRSAEKSVHEFLEIQLGFRVEDRTRQNVGYDLWAHSGSEEFYIEVKSLSYPGQPFALTPNEDSFVRDHGNQYVLALVLRTDSEVSIQFVRSPRDSLRFERQCRQWVWECSQYQFEAQFVLSLQRSR